MPVQIGDVVAGKYRIERVLGAGGMGVVVAATHIHLDEWVAIKFLLPEVLKDATVITRFLREAKVAAKLRSEHAARVHDVGTLRNGAPYLVMEYIEGNDLAAVVKSRGPLAPDAAVELALQVCEALADAHSIGIIHRDIKPANLIVTTRRDGTPAVKVIDFGISTVTRGPEAGAGITKTAEMRGSLLFMAPEQMAAPRSVDPRSDIWSLGVTLYYLVTGTYPFLAETMLELCAKILRNEPTPLRSVRPDLPEELEAVLLRCLRKLPSARYNDMAELAAALSRLAPARARVSADRVSRVLSLPSISVDGRESAPSSEASGGAAEVVAPRIEATLPDEASLIDAADGAAVPKAQELEVQRHTGKTSWGSTKRSERRSPTWGRAENIAAGFIAGLATAFSIAAGFMVLSRKGALETAESARVSGSALGAGGVLGSPAPSAPVTPEPTARGEAMPASAPAVSPSLSTPMPPPKSAAATAATPASFSPVVSKATMPRKAPSGPTSSPKRRPEPF